jgi:hypothetical protein
MRLFVKIEDEKQEFRLLKKFFVKILKQASFLKEKSYNKKDRYLKQVVKSIVEFCLENCSNGNKELNNMNCEKYHNYLKKGILQYKRKIRKINKMKHITKITTAAGTLLKEEFYCKREKLN